MSGYVSRTVAVLDVGCFSANLIVVDGSPARPVLRHKVRLRLDRAIDRAGRIDADGVNRITEAVAEVRRRMSTAPQAEFLPFATSSVRDAANADEIVTTVAERTGVRLRFLSGKKEARLAYLAARRWFDAEGPLAVLDVGGGTVEIALGAGDRPDFARCLPLGARTLTRAGLTDATGIPEMRDRLIDRISTAIPADVMTELRRTPAVGCSKVFQQLTMLTRAAKPDTLRADELAAWIPRIAATPVRQRATLRGISPHRAPQALAGAVVAEALMTATGHQKITICPWSTTEGALLHLLNRQRHR